MHLETNGDAVFDTISGLPLHPLAVHAVVVLLPLMCLVTIATAFWAPLRRYALLVAIVDGGVFVLAFVAKESGERLFARVTQFQQASGDLNTHITWGDRLPLLALLLFVMAVVLWWTSTRKPELVRVVGVVAALVAVATIGMTVVVGDTGARAVWSSVISSTK